MPAKKRHRTFYQSKNIYLIPQRLITGQFYINFVNNAIIFLTTILTWLLLKNVKNNIESLTHWLVLIIRYE